MTEVFTTGAFVKPIEVEINGVKQWRWIVDRFEDDSFANGKVVDVYEYTNTEAKLYISDDM